MADENRDVEMCTAHCDQQIHENNTRNMEFHEILEDDFRDLKYDIDKTSTPALPRTQSLKTLNFGQHLLLRQSSTPFLNTCEKYRHKSCTKQGQLFSSSPLTDSAFEELASCKLEFASSEYDVSHTVHNDMPTYSSSLESLPLKPSLLNHNDCSAAGYHSSGYHSLAQSEFSSGFSSMFSPAQIPSSVQVSGGLPIGHVMQNSLLTLKNLPNDIIAQQPKSNDVYVFPEPMEMSTDVPSSDVCPTQRNNNCNTLLNDSCSNLSSHALQHSDSQETGSFGPDTNTEQVYDIEMSPHINNIDSCSQSSSASHPLQTIFTDLTSTLPSICDISKQPAESITKPVDSSAQNKSTTSSATAPVFTPLQHERFKAVIDQHSPVIPDRLIGRRMGLVKVDIMEELSSLSLLSVIGSILEFVSDGDLLRMVKVSPAWCKLVETDTHGSRRLKHVMSSQTRLQELRQKENLVDKDSKRETRNLTESGLPFGMLQYKQAQIAPSPLGCISPTKSHAVTHQRYWKVASKLKNHESLRKCPKCLQPAKHHKEMERATCCNPQCQFTFCTNCFNAFHGSSTCSSTLGKRNKLSTPIGSMKSKKNLKRL